MTDPLRVIPGIGKALAWDWKDAADPPLDRLTSCNP